MHPAVVSAIRLIESATNAAWLLSVHAGIGEITDNECGRPIAEARMLLNDEVPLDIHGVPLLSRSLHWRNVMKVLHDVQPAFESASDKTTVARITAQLLEFIVGHRPTVERVERALGTLKQSGRPQKGGRSRTTELRDLFEELKVPSGTTEDRDLSTALSRILKDLAQTSISGSGGEAPRRQPESRNVDSRKPKTCSFTIEAIPRKP
jgi:hypothetical protein